ncbi:hypothetical protein [Plebeiibacterium sediminum]|uniref:Uncharacterized protein n=1 Tax=Plebeiibacterium sediminum TaxID=2992112 RepID=A0AAE3M5A5_9BACT|nr:hypothetical protein [Plebeiobacterium sediminum]MCW3787409.1 hypothetical protein [Plebeiobacterium sediminum]
MTQTWEAFALKYNAAISGMVNSYILEAKLIYKIDDFEIKISLLRQLSDNAARNFRDYLMTKNTIVEVSPLRINSDDEWKIIKYNRFLEFIYSFKKNCNRLAFDHNYMLISKNRVNENTLIKTRFWKFISQIAELRSIQYENQHLTLEFFNFLGTDSTEKLTKKILSEYKNGSAV